MNVAKFSNTVLPAETRINFITLVNGQYSVRVLNRETRSTKTPMRGAKEIMYKTIKGALNCNFAKQNGGVSILVDLNGHTDYAKAIITKL